MAGVSRVAVLHAMVPGGTLTEFQFSLPSMVAVVPKVVDVLISRVTSLRVNDGSEDDIELAFQEPLLNAVIHGNKEDPFKRVSVTLRCRADGEVQITVRDEGAGFEVDHVPDPTTPEHLLRKHGRGILLMRALMDDVSFENGGSIVHMRKGQMSLVASDQSKDMRFRAVRGRVDRSFFNLTGPKSLLNHRPTA